MSGLHPHERDAVTAIQFINDERGDEKIDPKIHALAQRLGASLRVKKKSARAIAASRTYRELGEALNGLG